MCLKVKDWPQNMNFQEKSPDRFFDLLNWLPLGDYTNPDGSLNLAGRLPSGIGLKPDLGPKMYIAYGFGKKDLRCGTTNLHMDISDAVNINVHVSVLKKSKHKNSRKNITQGALWHIFLPCDTEKLRVFIREVATERDIHIDPYHDDVIHEQRWYLDNTLLDRLFNKYGVKPITIYQNMGDAVFIPAGAPHQVRNINNCIKIAIDFVSPENAAECLRLSTEFSQLSDAYSNHEEKLQIKNILYHSMKDIVSVLSGNYNPTLHSCYI